MPGEQTDRVFVDLDPVSYHRDVLPDLLGGERGAMAGRDVDGVAPISLSIDGRSWTYRAEHGRVTVVEGEDPGAAAVVALSAAAWSDLAQFARTVPALQLAGELAFARGGFSHLARWEPALRAVYVGIPIFDPADTDLVDRDGTPLSLDRVFSLDDSDDDLAWFLDKAGYLHVGGVFTTDEIAALNAEVDRLAAVARPGDGRSWWASDPSGGDVLCRLVYAGLESAVIGGIEDDPRLQRLVALGGSEQRPVVDRMEGHSILLKSAGALQGLANIPWHVDCGLGGHPILCPSIAIGVQLTPASAPAGRFEVIAGSHGMTCRYGLDGDLAGLPYTGIDTRAGDVTVHYADVMHASPPPTGAGGRRVLYVTYVNPLLFDSVGPGEAINDLVRDRQTAAGSLARPSSAG